MRTPSLGGRLARLLISKLLASRSRRASSTVDGLLQHALRGRGSNLGRKVVASLEDPRAILLQSAIVAALLVRRSPRAAACVIGAPALALAACSIAKLKIDRARPFSHFFQAKGLQSFPSSHTAGKAALVWSLAFVLPMTTPRRIACATVAGLDTVAVAATRIADRAHWPTDTLAGAAVGIAAAEIVRRLVRPANTARQSDTLSDDAASSRSRAPVTPQVMAAAAVLRPPLALAGDEASDGGA